MTIHDWNRQHAITEIEWPTYESIVVAGDSDPEVEAGVETQDPGGDVVAKRVVRDFPAASATPTLHIPNDLPRVDFAFQPPTTPTYSESLDGKTLTGGQSMPARSSTDRKKDKLAEQTRG